MASYVRLDDARIEEMLKDEHGPVGQFLDSITKRMEAVAIMRVPVRVGNVWSEATTTARPPGYTKASIGRRIGHHGGTGGLYGSVNAAGNPTYFLEHQPDGAVQMHSRHPFLTTSLWEAEVF